MITRFVQGLIDRFFPPFDPVFRAVHCTAKIVVDADGDIEINDLTFVDEAEGDIEINDLTWPVNPGQPMMVAVDCGPDGDWVLVWWDPEEKAWVEA